MVVVMLNSVKLGLYGWLLVVLVKTCWGRILKGISKGRFWVHQEKNRWYFST